ncbi:hypothetical protein GCM10009638_26610 [Luteococcus sanguinis]
MTYDFDTGHQVSAATSITTADTPNQIHGGTRPCHMNPRPQEEAKRIPKQAAMLKSTIWNPPT